MPNYIYNRDFFKEGKHRERRQNNMYLTHGIRNLALNLALSSPETSATRKPSVSCISKYLNLNLKMFRKYGFVAVKSERNMSGIMKCYRRDINDNRKCLLKTIEYHNILSFVYWNIFFPFWRFKKKKRAHAEWEGEVYRFPLCWTFLSAAWWSKAI